VLRQYDFQIDRALAKGDVELRLASPERDRCSHRNFDGTGRCCLFHLKILEIVPIPDGYVKSIWKWVIRAMWPPGRLRSAKQGGKKTGRAG
jgi:hypothetical protein